MTSCFEKPFDVGESSALPQIGQEIAFACFNRSYEGLLQGVVTDARVTEEGQRVEVEYSVPIEDMRAWLPSTSKWKERPLSSR
ncbi:MAG: hypothetical protein A2908_04565 [Candidatus Staskawiczbacteria bacterium RIFCSPLOWO2_01_FULL_38_12b]|uniref:Uncharacterized protein n=1 Tax=Candidatus Staskawiczbacteria bacterium RIFCSPLOWO2_01_FULL_38_12b TaxID=1802214 RepID=A0A1G2ID20_9BACT|nr:MAG: hypothetical protein A2908_04565 [Candidatus Staskawiczbacteria bacterium RIFCSPLOWO2_01_FULL_38_12b]